MTEQEIAEIEKISGQVRGSVFQTDARYIIAKHGQPAITKVEAALKNSGNPFIYGNIKALEWLPLSLRTRALLYMRDILDWAEKDFREMGDSAPKYSFIIRLLSKFLISAQVTFNSAPQYWDRHYSIGTLIPFELNEIERRAVIRIENFSTHPLYCIYLEGFFRRTVQYLFPKWIVKATETKCIFRGDAFHEYYLTW